MLCPICRTDDNRVERTVDQGAAIARVRRCVCGHRFTTFETSEAELKRLRRIEQAAKAFSDELG
jgi:transcriptional regulator NrdR family protein